jgi:hypothetical protein
LFSFESAIQPPLELLEALFTPAISAPLWKKPNEMDKNEKLAPKLRIFMGV